MTAKERLIKELEQTPDFLVEEVLSFLLFLKTRLFSKLHSAQSTESTEASLLSWIDDISAQVPPQEWEKLPGDLSKNLDHYLYGAPKSV